MFLKFFELDKCRKKRGFTQPSFRKIIQFCHKLQIIKFNHSYSNMISDFTYHFLIANKTIFISLFINVRTKMCKKLVTQDQYHKMSNYCFFVLGFRIRIIVTYFFRKIIKGVVAAF